MATVEARIPLFDLITCVSDTVDLFSPAMTNHHMQVAYIAHSIASELGLPESERRAVLVAGSLHDIGAFSVKERMDTLQFEVNQPHYHARAGYQLLRAFPPFAEVATMVRYHHVPWNDGAGAVFEGEPVPMGSRILHVADRIAILVRPQEIILWQAERISKRIVAMTPSLFSPDAVEAFRRLSGKDYFWFDVASQSVGTVLRRRVVLDTLELDMDGLSSLANLFRRMIDFRSRFTASHSSGVAASAMALARLAGFSERECRLVEISGHLHDLGKLGIPQEILEKPAHLDEHEYDIMRSHVYHTFRILEPVVDLDTIRTWGALHQEYLDGTGYPFRLTAKDLPPGSRLLTVADIFTALTEDRPYREGLPAEKAMGILQKLSEHGKLDPDLVAVLKANFDDINQRRVAAQTAAEDEYRQFIAVIGD